MNNITNIVNPIKLCQKGLIRNILSKNNNINKIIIASAFFTDFDFLKEIYDKVKNIELYVSRKFPTSPYELEKALILDPAIKCYYLDEKFHSKIILFYEDNNNLKSAIVGSSNFTKNGLSTNIETNVFIEDKDLLNELKTHFENDIEHNSAELNTNKIQEFKKKYDKFKKVFRKIQKIDKLYNTSLKIHKFNDITKIKEHIEKEMNKNIFSNTNAGLRLRKYDKKIYIKNRNISFKKHKDRKSSEVYIYIDFNLMYKIPDWDNNKKLKLNLCINNSDLKEELQKKGFNISQANTFRKTYASEVNNLNNGNYYGDLKIETFEDLEEVLIIARDFLKSTGKIT